MPYAPRPIADIHLLKAKPGVVYRRKRARAVIRQRGPKGGKGQIVYRSTPSYSTNALLTECLVWASTSGYKIGNITYAKGVMR